MDLDYKSVKALSSPTRLEILKMVLDEEATTTKISDELDKSKSTISSHLDVLTDSGLLEKDEEEGRRRVVYRPTSKAEAIANGRERKVKFSVVSSALTALTGSILVASSFTKRLTSNATDYSASSQESAGAMTAMDAPAPETEQASTKSVELLQNLPEDTLIYAGIFLLLASGAGLIYAYVHRSLGNNEE